MLARGWEVGEMRIANEYGVSFWGHENILERGVIIAQLREYAPKKLHRTIFFKMVKFMVCKLYLS